MIRYAWKNNQGLYCNGKGWTADVENALFTSDAASTLLPVNVERHTLCAVPIKLQDMKPVWNVESIINEIMRQRAVKIRCQNTMEFELNIDESKLSLLQPRLDCRDCSFTNNEKIISGMTLKISAQKDHLFVTPKDLLPD